MLHRSSRLAPIARRALPAAVRLPARAVAGSAAGNQQATADSGKFDALDKRRRQLLYRSKQRGWCRRPQPSSPASLSGGIERRPSLLPRLEMDIMLGGWASARLADLSEDQAPPLPWPPPPPRCAAAPAALHTRCPRHIHSRARLFPSATPSDAPPVPSSPQLTQFAEIIEMENPDLYCWLTGQQDVPDDISNPLLRTLCAPSLPTPL